MFDFIDNSNKLFFLGCDANVQEREAAANLYCDGRSKNKIVGVGFCDYNMKEIC